MRPPISPSFLPAACAPAFRGKAEARCGLLLGAAERAAEAGDVDTSGHLLQALSNSLQFGVVAAAACSWRQCPNALP